MEMVNFVGPSWWRPYETASQQYTDGPAAIAGTLAERLKTTEPGAPSQQTQLDVCMPSGSLDSAVIHRHDSGDSGILIPGGTAASSCHVHQYEAGERQRSTTAYIPIEQAPGSPLSFRQALDSHQHLFEVPPPCNSVRRCVQTVEAARRNQRFAQQKASPRPHRETPYRVASLQCTPYAVAGPPSRYLDVGGIQSAMEPRSRSLAMNEDASDRLKQVEKILDKLMHEARVLRMENRKLRATRGDLRHIAGIPQQTDSVGGGDCAARLKCEIDMLRRRLREQDEKLRHLHNESAYMDACRELTSKAVLALEGDRDEGKDSEDEETLKARLLLKNEALKQSEQEISALRSELALQKCSDESRKTELEELRSHCRKLKCQLLEKQQEVQSCAIETVSLGAKAAAAKGAQMHKAWEFEQMERRFQDQLSQQVKGRLGIEAGKHEAEREVERLRDAFRSATERALCQAEQLQDRSDEVQLLQQRVDRLCRQREQDTAKLKAQGAAMLRWRTYIRFLEKVIRDLRVYIVSQAAAASAGSLLAAPDARSRSSSMSGGLREAAVAGSLQQERRRLKDRSQERRVPLRRQHVGTEIPDSLAALGYNLLPSPFSPGGPSLPQPFPNTPSTLPKTPRTQAVPRRERLGVGLIAPPNDENGSVEQLGRLMKEAAEELRATAAAARRGQTSTRLRSRRPCCISPVLGGVSSPGSTEASSISGIGDSAPFSPVEQDPATQTPPSEFLGALRVRDLIPPTAYAVFSERPLVSDRGCLAYPEASSLMDAGSLSDFSGLIGAQRRRRGNSLRWLSKGAAAAHLAKEISIRFPGAFDRLQKSVPSCRLLNKT